MEEYCKTRPWEEIEEGDQLQEIKLFVSYRKVIQNVVATRDLFPGHHNPEYARAQGVENIYLQTNFFQGIMDRLITDAFGPKAWIRRRKMQMIVPVPAERNISIVGRVSRKYIKNGERLIDVDVTVLQRDGIFAEACKAVISVLFPAEPVTKNSL